MIARRTVAKAVLAAALSPGLRSGCVTGVLLPPVAAVSFFLDSFCFSGIVPPFLS